MNPITTSLPGHTSRRPATWTDQSARRALIAFAAIAVPIGWVLLGIPVALGLPLEPFVLGVLLFGLVIPALVLTARRSGRAGVLALLRDAVRLPRPLVWLPASVVVLPAAVWVAAAILGSARPVTSELLVEFAVLVVSGALVINIVEETVWTGFAQRRAMAVWGALGGSLLAALLFAGIHLPLAFAGAHSVGDVGLGLVALVATAVGLRLLIARVDGWSGRSLLTVGFLHAAFNASSILVSPSYDWVRLAVTVVLGVAAFASPFRVPGRPGTLDPAPDGTQDPSPRVVPPSPGQ